jgi:hypothetical protein
MVMFLLRAMAIASSERLPITLFCGSSGSGPSIGKPVRSWPMRVDSSETPTSGCSSASSCSSFSTASSWLRPTVIDKPGMIFRESGLRP